MSAFKVYQWSAHDPIFYGAEEVDARIAKLEAKLNLALLCTRAEKRENTILHGKLADELLKREQAEAELEALKERRCEECKHWRKERPGIRGWPSRCVLLSWNVAPDFSCNLWAEREKP